MLKYLKGFNLAETKIKETDQGECPKIHGLLFFSWTKQLGLGDACPQWSVGWCFSQPFMKLGICIVTGSWMICDDIWTSFPGTFKRFQGWPSGEVLGSSHFVAGGFLWWASSAAWSAWNCQEFVGPSPGAFSGEGGGLLRSSATDQLTGLGIKAVAILDHD